MDEQLADLYMLEGEEKLEVMALTEPHQGTFYGPPCIVPKPNLDMTFDEWVQSLTDLECCGLIRVAVWPKSAFDFARVEKVYRS